MDLARVPRTVGAVLVVAGLLVLSGQAPVGAAAPVSLGQAVAAAAQPLAGSDVYTVTLAARVCPTYPDVMANRGRNNLQESLEDLGMDSVYQSGQPVDPSIEGPNDPNCQPLDGWRFTLGNSPNGPKVDHLSTVTNGGPPTAPTTTVPLLDSAGNPTGQSIAGAVNLTLTPSQVIAAQNRQVYFQGGTPADPLLNGVFPGQYAFAALRCAIDNYNADNVEWVSYPTTYHHLFCYQYLVTPPPDAATIVVRKQLQGGTDGPGTFRYVGNISYTAANDFSLTVNTGTPASTSFVRAAGLPWDFTEQPLAGWTLTDLSCTPASAAVITGPKVVVTAAANQTVTCTYTNQRNPTGALQLDKTTLGAVGTFPFHVVRPAPEPPLDTPVSTTAQGVAVPVVGSAGSTPGTYTATETLPAATAAGSWELTSAQCNGTDVTGTVTANGQDRTLSRTVAVGAQGICNMTNTFTPDGSITIRKTTHGGVGTFTYVVVDLLDPSDPTVIGQQQATTATAGTAATATGDALDHLYAGDPDDPSSTSHSYTIGEIGPPDTLAGSWRLTGVTCTNGLVRTPFNGHVTFELTTASPDVTCDFSNTFLPTATLDLSKVVDDPDAVRTGPVTVHLTCTDGTDQLLTGPAGQPGPFEIDTLVFRDPTTCTAQETATGAGAGATVTTRIDLDDDGVTSVNADSATFPVRPGHDIAVTVNDTYAAEPTGGGSTPTTGPGSPPTSGSGLGVLPANQSQGTLPATGPANDPRKLIGSGLILVLAGVVLLIVSAQRRRPE